MNEFFSIDRSAYSSGFWNNIFFSNELEFFQIYFCWAISTVSSHFSAISADEMHEKHVDCLTK